MGTTRRTTAKFRIGDIVYFSDRCPVFLKVKRRKRKIVDAYYDPIRKCKYYILGSNNKGNAIRYGFRSYMLKFNPVGHRPKKD